MYLADPFGITPYKSSYLIINMNQNIINSRLLISPLHSARRLPKSILHFFSGTYFRFSTVYFSELPSSCTARARLFPETENAQPTDRSAHTEGGRHIWCRDFSSHGILTFSATVKGRQREETRRKLQFLVYLWNSAFFCHTLYILPYFIYFS